MDLGRGGRSVKVAGGEFRGLEAQLRCNCEVNLDRYGAAELEAKALATMPFCMRTRCPWSCFAPIWNIYR